MKLKKQDIPYWARRTARGLAEVRPYVYTCADTDPDRSCLAALSAWANGLGWGAVTAMLSPTACRIADPVCGELERLGLL